MRADDSTARKGMVLAGIFGCVGDGGSVSNLGVSRASYIEAASNQYKGGYKLDLELDQLSELLWSMLDLKELVEGGGGSGEWYPTEPGGGEYVVNPGETTVSGTNEEKIMDMVIKMLPKFKDFLRKVNEDVKIKTAVGAIAGVATQNGRLNNCWNKGSVTAEGSRVICTAGGIAGLVDGATISGCQNAGAVSAQERGSRGNTIRLVLGAGLAGGIDGLAIRGRVSNCNNVGVVDATVNGSKSTGSGLTNLTLAGHVAGAGGIEGAALYGEVSGCQNTGGVHATESGNELGVLGLFIPGGDGGGLEGIGQEITQDPAKILEMDIDLSLCGGVSGGIVAAAVGLERLSGCSSAGRVTAKGTLTITGGVAGVCLLSPMSGCSNTGRVATIGEGAIKLEVEGEAKSLTGGLAGGVAGVCLLSSANSCYNTGEVTGNNADGSVGAFDEVAQTKESCGYLAGGVAGFCLFSPANSCHNTGKVTTKGTVVISGGVAGACFLSPASRCYNTGSVSANGMSSEAGGVVGGGDSVIIGCYNTGSVSANGMSSEAGGITVAVSDNSTIIGCYNTGSISAAGMGEASIVGGIVGQGNAQVSTCYNAGTLQAGTGGYVGAIVGKVERIDYSLQYCYYLPGNEAVGNRANNNAFKEVNPVLGSNMQTEGFVNRLNAEGIKLTAAFGCVQSGAKDIFGIELEKTVGEKQLKALWQKLYAQLEKNAEEIAELKGQAIVKAAVALGSAKEAIEKDSNNTVKAAHKTALKNAVADLETALKAQQGVVGVPYELRAAVKVQIGALKGSPTDTEKKQAKAGLDAALAAIKEVKGWAEGTANDGTLGKAIPAIESGLAALERAIADSKKTGASQTAIAEAQKRAAKAENSIYEALRRINAVFCGEAENLVGQLQNLVGQIESKMQEESMDSDILNDASNALQSVLEKIENGEVDDGALNEVQSILDGMQSALESDDGGYLQSCAEDLRRLVEGSSEENPGQTPGGIENIKEIKAAIGSVKDELGKETLNKTALITAMNGLWELISQYSDSGSTSSQTVEAMKTSVFKKEAQSIRMYIMCGVIETVGEEILQTPNLGMLFKRANLRTPVLWWEGAYKARVASARVSTGGQAEFYMDQNGAITFKVEPDPGYRTSKIVSSVPDLKNGSVLTKVPSETVVYFAKAR